MKNFYLIAAVSIIILLILLGVIYWYVRFGDEVKVVTETPKEEVLQSVSTNPLDNKPNINPVDQTNPFKNIKTNPFE